MLDERQILQKFNNIPLIPKCVNCESTEIARTKKCIETYFIIQENIDQPSVLIFLNS